MSASDRASIGITRGTKEKFDKKKEEAGGEGLSDDAFLSMILDFFSPDIRLAMTRNHGKNHKNTGA